MLYVYYLECIEICLLLLVSSSCRANDKKYYLTLLLTLHFLFRISRILGLIKGTFFPFNSVVLEKIKDMQSLSLWHVKHGCKMMAKDHILAFIIICSKMFFISFQKVNIHKILSLTALLHLYRILKKIITKILFTITCNEIATKCKKKVTLIFSFKNN